MNYSINSVDLCVALTALSLDAQTLRKLADGIGKDSASYDYFIEGAQRREATHESIVAQMDAQR